MTVFMKSRTRTAASVTVMAIVAGMTAATAVAVPPPPDSVFQGQTSQNIKRNGVQVETNASGLVQRAFVQWRAKCAAKGKFWTSTTKVSRGSKGLPQDGDVFSYKHTYTGNAGGGIKGKITYNFKGSFSDNDNAAGTWSAKVIVKRNGRKIDTCKVKGVTWTASRVEQQG